MLYLLPHGGLLSVNHINVLFHFTLCDANFSESQEREEFTLQETSYCVHSKGASRHRRAPVTSRPPPHALRGALKPEAAGLSSVSLYILAFTLN